MIERWLVAVRDHPDRPRGFDFHVSRAVGLNVVLLLVLGACGHNLYRFHWVWFAAFQAVALHCTRRQAAAAAAGAADADGVPGLARA